MTDHDRLKRLLGGEDLTWLVVRARRRLEQGLPLTGPVTLSSATPAQRRAIATLLGRRQGTGTSLTVNLDEVDRVLRDSAAADGLAAAIVILTGPIEVLADLRLQEETAWRDAYAGLDAALDGRPELAAWRAWLDSTGLPRRLAPDPADAKLLLDPLAAIMKRLPVPAIPIGRLAAETCGDAHALDEGNPLATLAFSGARALAGLSFAADNSAESRRAVWAAVGVHMDELSSTVLTLGLLGDAATSLGTILTAATHAGEPAVLTLRHLRRHVTPIVVPTVHLCENPVVIAAAADDLGSACPPLICVGGRPTLAVWRLLTLLSEGGATFHYHGDFDWGGIAIATAVHTRIGFHPWHYDTPAYKATPSTTPLTGRPLPTPWDPTLTTTMQSRSLRIEEELTLPTLLTDLRQAAAPK